MPKSITIRKPLSIDVDTLRVVLPADCMIDEDDAPLDLPGTGAETWTAEIDLDTGRIKDWRGGGGGSLRQAVRLGHVHAPFPW